jgi:hypothetical protein
MTQVRITFAIAVGSHSTPTDLRRVPAEDK